MELPIQVSAPFFFCFIFPPPNHPGLLTDHINRLTFNNHSLTTTTSYPSHLYSQTGRYQILIYVAGTRVFSFNLPSLIQHATPRRLHLRHFGTGTGPRIGISIGRPRRWPSQRRHQHPTPNPSPS